MGNKPFVLLFSRCESCGKMVRYSESAFKNHAALHQTGKLSCELCQGMDQGADKRFTKESLAAHNRRMHTKGAFPCKVEGEQMESEELLAQKKLRTEVIQLEDMLAQVGTYTSGKFLDTS